MALRACGRVGAVFACGCGIGFMGAEFERSHGKQAICLRTCGDRLVFESLFFVRIDRTGGLGTGIFQEEMEMELSCAKRLGTLARG